MEITGLERKAVADVGRAVPIYENSRTLLDLIAEVHSIHTLVKASTPPAALTTGPATAAATRRQTAWPTPTAEHTDEAFGFG